MAAWSLVFIKWIIPQEYQIIEPISLYGSILASVIFVYGFILGPAISEYKESERLLNDIRVSLNSIALDARYFFELTSKFELSLFCNEAKILIHEFYDTIADHKHANWKSRFEPLNSLLISGEKGGITANHIIRMKQEIGIVKKAMYRIHEIYKKDSLPNILHILKNCITGMVLIMLLFFDIWHESAFWISQIQESIILFLLSFLYIYLFFVVRVFENPFDKRRFSGYIEMADILEIQDVFS
jgi:hypothetical protein